MAEKFGNSRANKFSWYNSQEVGRAGNQSQAQKSDENEGVAIDVCNMHNYMTKFNADCVTALCGKNFYGNLSVCILSFIQIAENLLAILFNQFLSEALKLIVLWEKHH